MKTGEGKTLVAPMAAILNSLTGRGVHIVTVNDYLARRDPQWMGPVFHFLGISLGMITHDESFLFEPGYPTTDERLINLRPVTRREAYAADVTYGTNNEFGFDYLRDNMVIELDQRVQRERSFAIVDEVDNILIDEARTPLIISGQAEESGDLYYTFARLVPKLKGRPEGDEEGGDYFVDLKDRAVSPTEEGVDKMEKLLGVANLYDADPRLARHFEQALRAHALYKRDKDYIVKDGEIVIVDEFTGRQMPGRRWSEGLHQAIEAKEGLRVQRESVTLATITFQNYFRLYDKLAGMTGTAMTEAEEFHKIYELEVVAIPTNVEMIREDDSDLVFRNEGGKFNAVIDEIVEMQEAGRPVLVGTVSVEKSEVLSTLLKRRGIKHETLNAKFHEKESGIIAQAGRTGAITIATNMAGRGTDILLGGNPAGLAREILHKRGLNPAEVDKATYDAALAEAKADHRRGPRAGRRSRRPPHHRHGAPRQPPDRQPAPRPRRPPGRPGLVALLPVARRRPDEALRVGPRRRASWSGSGLEDDVAIESRIVSKTIESAQSRVEGFNFDMRKRVVEFDDVINRQRETIYAERDKVLRNEDLTETVRTFVEDEIHAIVDTPPRQRQRRRLGHGGPRRRPPDDGRRRPRDDRGRALGARRPRRDPRAPPRAHRRAARVAREGGRRGRLGDRRTTRPRPVDRLAVGRAPHRDRRHAAGHRPARLRPAGSAQRVPSRGVPPLRRAPRPHPPPGRDDDLPGHGDPPGAAESARGHRRHGPVGRRRERLGRLVDRDGDPSGRRAGVAPGSALGRGRPARSDRRSPAASPRIRWPAPCAESSGGGAAGGRGETRLHADRRTDRAQRHVLVRLRPEVQEVPRPLTSGARALLGPRADRCCGT